MSEPTGDDQVARASRRDRSILQTLLASSGLQLAALAVTFASLPFVTRALTTEAYGVLATLTGFVALLGFADLGVGGAVTTRLAMATGKDDSREASGVVSTGFVSIVTASLVLLAVGSLMTLLLPWRRILGVHALSDHAVRVAVFCTVASVSLSVIGSLGQRVLYGIQRGSAANLWLLAATLIGATCSIAASLFDAPLYVFVLAGIGSAALVGVVCTWWVLCRAPGAPRVRRDAIHLETLGTLARSSGWFFAISVSSVVGYQTDTLIIAHLLGASDAGVYNTAARMYGLILAVLFPALLQLWPAIGEAYARGDISWIRSRLRWATALVTAAAAIAGLAIALTGRSVIGAAFGHSLVPPQGLLNVMAIFTTVSLAAAPPALLLNAVGHVRTHAFLAIAVGITNLPLSWFLTSRVGITGPALGSLLTNFSLALVPSAFLVRRILRQASEHA